MWKLQFADFVKISYNSLPRILPFNAAGDILSILYLGYSDLHFLVYLPARVDCASAPKHGNLDLCFNSFINTQGGSFEQVPNLSAFYIEDALVTAAADRGAHFERLSGAGARPSPSGGSASGGSCCN